MSHKEIGVERQNRYLVVKHEDINAYLISTERQQLEELIDLIVQAKKIAESKDPSRYVVVAEDWPMYEDTWRAIERWVDGEEQPTTQSLTDQIKAIPWASWVKWVAHDEDGSWWLFEYEPIIKYGILSWCDSTDLGKSAKAYINFSTFSDWREYKVRVNE